jgi:hypothetical protein
MSAIANITKSAPIELKHTNTDIIVSRSLSIIQLIRKET